MVSAAFSCKTGMTCLHYGTPHLSLRLCKLLVGLLQLSSQVVLPMLCSTQPLLTGSQLYLYAAGMLKRICNLRKFEVSIRVSEGAEGDKLMQAA